MQNWSSVEIVSSSAGVGSRQSQWPAKHAPPFSDARKSVNTVPSAAADPAAAHQP
jgi:hypothetical protein